MNKKTKQLKPFEYEEDDFTPGFVFAVALTIAGMIAVAILFAMVVASGIVFVGSQIN
jgi:hypothetical protein